MTTEDLLWDEAFERNMEEENFIYNYEEEWNMEKYYEDKELFERFNEYFRSVS